MGSICLLQTDNSIQKIKMTQQSKEPRKLNNAAKRALAEAKARKAKALTQTLPTEIDGRDGPEPTRYGDWEKDGIISDF
jgi:hypothetical protein